MIIQIYKSNKGSVNVPVLDKDFLAENDNESIYANIIFGMNVVAWLMQQGVFVLLGVLYFNTVLQSYEKWYKEMPMMTANKIPFLHDHIPFFTSFCILLINAK